MYAIFLLTLQKISIKIQRKMSPILTVKKSNYRWVICSFLFFATMINYLDRQVLPLTWHNLIAPEFAWTDEDYGKITSIFALTYAICMLFAGKLIDIAGEKKGFAWAMVIWSIGAVLHALCGIATCGVLTGEWFVGFNGAKETLHDYGIVGLPITTISVNLFIICRIVLAIGQSGSFPAAIRATTEYFPQKDRTYAISVFNNGASVGALFAPILLPLIANRFGWEIAFFIIGCLGYLWVLIWLIFYYKLSQCIYVNHPEREYILQDESNAAIQSRKVRDSDNEKYRKNGISILKCFTYPQTWALIIGKFMTDGVWWFFLFWTPNYISEFYSYTPDSTMGMSLIIILYLISMLSVAGAYLPTYLVNNKDMSPEASQLHAMFVFAVIQLIGISAVPLGEISPWLFVIVIGIQGASHQSWSATVFSLTSAFFPKHSIGTITGITGMAGGVASYLIMTCSGTMLTAAENTGNAFYFLNYEGKQAVYMIVFCCFSVMYLIGWLLMKLILADRSKIIKK